MTALAKLLEYLATADKGQVDIVAYSRTSWLVRASDLDDVHAAGVGPSLESASSACLADALDRGLMAEPCPETLPPPKTGGTDG